MGKNTLFKACDMSDKVTIDRALLEEVMRIAETRTTQAFDSYKAVFDGELEDYHINRFEAELATIERAMESIK